MTYIHSLPTFLIRSTPIEAAMVNDANSDVLRCADKLGADYVYVAKNKTGAYYPLTFAFYAEGGKFLARRTFDTMMQEAAA